jgi:hypothetical protein
VRSVVDARNIGDHEIYSGSVPNPPFTVLTPITDYRPIKWGRALSSRFRLCKT